jgi:hypothetical protein
MIFRRSNLPDPSEHSLQVQALQYLLLKRSHPDIFGFAVPNAGRRGFQTAQKMKSEGLLPGVADICVMLLEAKTGWLEMKKHGGRQSDEQMGFAARCARLGHPYGIAYTLDEAIAFFERIGAVRP